MRGGFARPLGTFAFSLPLLLLLALSGCSLFNPPAPVVEAAPPVAASAPEVASEPEAASAPEVASAPEATIEEKPLPRKPHFTLLRRRPPAPRRPERPAPPPAPAPAPLVTTRAIEHGTYRTLLDSAVQKTDHKVVGHAVDLVAGPDGKPVEIVVNLQGFMGIGDRKAGFPWSAVRVNTELGTPAITLALAPNQVPQPGGAAPQEKLPDEAGPTRLPMLDANIERADGGSVGRVVDVLLDSSASPLAVVLDVSGTLEKRHTIAANWSALHFVTKNHRLTAQLDLNAQQIGASPRYASGDLVLAVTPAAQTRPAASASASAPAPASTPAASAHGVK